MKIILPVAATALVLGATWALVGGMPAVTAQSAAKPADKIAPEFAGISDWLNGKALKLADQKGKVVVVHFWTNGCINCVHNYPHYNAWQEKYKDEKNYLMVGVHTPEFKSEKDLDRLKERLTTNKLTFAVAVDNNSKTWAAWGNQYWPCIYLVDKAGVIRHKWEGELGDAGNKTMTKQIDALLAEPAK